MIQVLNDNLLAQPVDAIVNAANGHLRHGGGLARAVAVAAAPYVGVREYITAEGPYSAQQVLDARAASEAWRLEQEQHPLIATGDVGLTSAGALPQKAVIHAVGPIWGGGELYEEDLLFLAYQNAFERAIAEGFTSIAVPALGMGIFGCPREVVARTCMSAALEYSDQLDITVCLTNDEDRDAFVSAGMDAAVGACSSD
jgi:O-acetyl-ADP-ribose deacetylase (regulator of RNase III)